MIGLVATLKVLPDKGAELEAVFAELTAQVRANEQGCLLYQLTRTRADPTVYKVLELYADLDAQKAHGRSDHFRAANPKIGACLDGPPQLDQLDVIE
jgi:quinol monooxygenase YgiN